MNKIMNKIKKGELKMRPKAYFILGSMLLGAGIVGATLLATMMTGMGLFIWRTQGRALMLVPWRAIGLTGIGLAGGTWLLKKNSEAYKVGWGWLILGMIATVLVLGLLMDKTGMQERIWRQREFKPVYDWMMPRPGGQHFDRGNEIKPGPRQYKGYR